VLGAIFLIGVPLIPGLRDVQNIDLLTSGLGVLGVLLFLPGGFAEGAYRIRDVYLKRVAAKHGIVVASMVADSRAIVDDDIDITEVAAELEEVTA
jgi:hypothetical protein